MTRSRLQFDVCIAIRSPFLFQGLTAAALGVDASALRDENHLGVAESPGVPILPGDHVRGHLREAFEFLASNAPASGFEQADVDDLFGQVHDMEADNPELPDGRTPGNLFIADLEARKMLVDESVEDLPKSGSFTRVKIDRATGAAETGMLQVVELVAPLHATVLFKGTFSAYAPEEHHADIAAHLQKALRLVPAMGAIKTAGFGEVVHELSHVKPGKVRPCVLASESDAPADRIALTVTFDRPLLVDTERVADNVFRGRPVVPGAALKGALARALAAGGYDPTDADDPLADALSRIVFHHARLVTEGGEESDRPLPLSLATGVDETTVVDLLMVPDGTPALVGGKAPVLESDWKDEHKKAAHEAWNRPASNLPGLARGRTAIERDTGVALDQQLFVTVARPTGGRSWTFEIDSSGDESGWYPEIVATLKGGLDAIGRTNASLSVTHADAAPDAKSDPEPLTFDGSECWPLMLETSAVLTDPASSQPVHEQYTTSLRKLLGNPDILIRSQFTKRRLAGGFVAMRGRQYGPEKYCPFELTEAGSVFLVEGFDRDAVERVCRAGLDAVLPQPDGTVRRLDWRNCIYVAANGYGAVSVNTPKHRELAWSGNT